MLSERELLNAIDKLEQSCSTFQSCEKLATFYTLYDHLYGNTPQVTTSRETVIGNYGNTEFLKLVDGKNAEQVWSVIDELMQTIMILDSKLYKSVIRRIEEG